MKPHRFRPSHPQRLYDFANGAKARLQGGHRRAGGAAHLPGMTAAMTPLPVFGVPVESKALSGQDSLLSIVQMPAGIPVGTLAIGRAGAINAALLAAAVLALNDEALADGSMPGAQSQTGCRRRAPLGRGMTGALAPGSTIGIIGGGQLGRMLAMAAARLGYRTIVLEPQPTAPPRRSPTGRSSPPMTTPTRLPTSRRTLRRRHLRVRERAGRAAELLSARCAGLPPPRALEVAQDRRDREIVPQRDGRAHGRLRARRRRRRPRDGLAGSVAAACSRRAASAMTARASACFAMRMRRTSGVYAQMGGVPLILEALVPFEREISVIAARGATVRSPPTIRPRTCIAPASCTPRPFPLRFRRHRRCGAGPRTRSSLGSTMSA
jgi:phosphoribosylcarboxyaminoimidazole (NCAIR) mutase